MTSIIEFFRARLDEEQALAEAATQAPWWYDRTAMWLDGEDFVTFDHGKGQEYIGYGERPLSGAIAITGPAGHRQSMADAAHIAAQDPARTLRRVAALRAALDECAYWYDKVNADADHAEKHPQPDLGGRFEVAMQILFALAEAWDWHPDYDPAWRPR